MIETDQILNLKYCVYVLKINLQYKKYKNNINKI